MLNANRLIVVLVPDNNDLLYFDSLRDILQWANIVNVFNENDKNNFEKKICVNKYIS